MGGALGSPGVWGMAKSSSEMSESCSLIWWEGEGLGVGALSVNRGRASQAGQQALVRLVRRLLLLLVWIRGLLVRLVRLLGCTL